MKPIVARVEQPKGRICLGKIAKGISSFRVTREADGSLLLHPMVEVPLSVVKNASLTTQPSI